MPNMSCYSTKNHADNLWCKSGVICSFGMMPDATTYTTCKCCLGICQLQCSECARENSFNPCNQIRKKLDSHPETTDSSWHHLVLTAIGLGTRCVQMTTKHVALFEAYWSNPPNLTLMFLWLVNPWKNLENASVTRSLAWILLPLMTSHCIFSCAEINGERFYMSHRHQDRQRNELPVLLCAWACPRYNPTYNFGCIPFATGLATAKRQWTDSPNSATNFFQARSERRISAVKPSLPILKKLIGSTAIVGIRFKMEWYSTICLKYASRANFRVRVCRFTSRMADSTTPQIEMPTKSQSWDLRSMASYHFATSLCDTQIDATKTPTTTWYTHPLLLLEDKLPHKFQFSHLSQTKWAICFVSFCRRRHLLCHQASNYQIQSPQWVLVLSTKLPSLVSSNDPTCSHVRITPNSMLDMSRCNMVFDFKLCRSTSDHNNIGSVNLNRLITNACIHNLAFNKHDLHLNFWRLNKKQLWTKHPLAIGLAPFMCAESSPTDVSHALSTINDCFVWSLVAGFLRSHSPDTNVSHQIHWQSPFERAVKSVLQMCWCKRWCSLHSRLQLQHGPSCELCSPWSEFCGHVPSYLGISLHTRTQWFLVRASLHGRKLNSPEATL